MPHPIVNLNGTSKKALVQQTVDVREALVALHGSLREAAPHGRDYQTHTDPDAYRKEAAEAEAEREFVDKLLDKYALRHVRIIDQG